MSKLRTFDQIKEELNTGLKSVSTDSERVTFLTEQVFKTRCEIELLKRQVSRIGDAFKYKEILQELYGNHHDKLLPQSIYIDARDALDHADGLNHLEYDTSGSAFRWTGPTSRTTFRFWCDRRAPIIIKLFALSGGDKRNATAMSFEVDGRTHPLNRIGDEESFIAGPISPSMVDTETVAVLRVPYLIEVPDESEKGKILGIRIRSLEVRSIED